MTQSKLHHVKWADQVKKKKSREADFIVHMDSSCLEVLIL